MLEDCIIIIMIEINIYITKGRQIELAYLMLRKDQMGLLRIKRKMARIVLNVCLVDPHKFLGYLCVNFVLYAFV